MIRRALGWLFEKIYDFIMGGGLKKALLGLAVLAVVGGLAMYVVYPEFTATIVSNVLGADPAAEFEPVEAGAGTTYYEGAISGNAGPTGGAVDGTVLAKVNFERGRVAGNVTGTYSGQGVTGFLQGTITDDGTTVGTGQATALSVATVKFRFNGGYTADGTEASGTWRSTTNIRGDGEWRIERIDESEYRRLEDELFGE